ncbi:hypothetical protein ACD578_05320 [Microvirga sp. RSM25]|uniref:hypothetical protein n=1 Tax=Microvirga sp. RSM25 TaxID=3273802 RepID=UPI00384F156E
MAQKETIDIEALLVRAYRQYQVDRATPEKILGLVVPMLPSESNYMIVARHLAYGTSIDTSPAGANILGRATDAAAVPEDLFAVHDAVLALDDYFIERARDVCMVWDRETAARADVEIWQQDGEWFARAKRWGAGEPEPPARRLQQVSTSVIVILNARAGIRPTVDDLEIVDQRPIYRGARKEPVGYEPVYLISPEMIAVQRAEYQVWHCALALLAAQISELDTLTVTGPAAPLSPWDEKVIHTPNPLDVQDNRTLGEERPIERN